MDGGDVTGKLLGDDADEEVRMQDRVSEKAEHAKEGKSKRITVEGLDESKRSA